jgi:hypothetical protein
MKLTTDIHLVPRARMMEDIPSLSCMSSWNGELKTPIKNRKKY